VFAPGDLIAGKTYADMSAAWWQWALAIPKADNPIEGQDCAVGQSGDVWFLAGSDMSTSQMRTCQIPEGKIVFFPIVNQICFPCPETFGCANKTKAALQACTNLKGTNLSVKIDDTSIPGLDSFKFASDIFSFQGNSSDPIFDCIGPVAANSCGIPVGDRYGLSQGYWIAVRPLAKGMHTLSLHGEIKGFAQDLTYTITVP
jgi:hypothetical protein